MDTLVFKMFHNKVTRRTHMLVCTHTHFYTYTLSVYYPHVPFTHTPLSMALCRSSTSSTSLDILSLSCPSTIFTMWPQPASFPLLSSTPIFQPKQMTPLFPSHPLASLALCLCLHHSLCLNPPLSHLSISKSSPSSGQTKVSSPRTLL